MIAPDDQRLPGCSVLPAMMPTAKPPGTTRSRPKRQTAERFATINGFVDCALADLSRAAALTWLVLWRDTKNGTARTSAADIARRIGTSRRAVTTALADLKRKGLVTIVRRGGLNSGPTTYRVHPFAQPP